MRNDGVRCEIVYSLLNILIKTVFPPARSSVIMYKSDKTPERALVLLFLRRVHPRRKIEKTSERCPQLAKAFFCLRFLAGLLPTRLIQLEFWSDNPPPPPLPHLPPSTPPLKIATFLGYDKSHQAFRGEISFTCPHNDKRETEPNNDPSLRPLFNASPQKSNSPRLLQESRGVSRRNPFHMPLQRQAGNKTT